MESWVLKVLGMRPLWSFLLPSLTTAFTLKVLEDSSISHPRAFEDAVPILGICWPSLPHSKSSFGPPRSFTAKPSLNKMGSSTLVAYLFSSSFFWWPIFIPIRAAPLTFRHSASSYHPRDRSSLSLVLHNTIAIQHHSNPAKDCPQGCWILKASKPSNNTTKLPKLTAVIEC